MAKLALACVLCILTSTLFGGEDLGWRRNRRSRSRDDKPPIPLVNYHRTASPLWLPGQPLEEQFAQNAYKVMTSAENSANPTSPSFALDIMRMQLNAKIIGQPEVVECLLAVEERRMIMGEWARQNPEVFWLMGLPGTGKDTTVKAYAELLHPRENNFEKHIYHLAPVTKEADFWKLFGSATGYIGSQQPSHLLRWLVQHSGGRYEIREGKDNNNSEKKDEGWWIEEVSGWRKLQEKKRDLSFSPERAILYIDEFHEWDMDAKDLMLKAALTEGNFPVNNPGRGVDKIYVPLTIVIASNDGIGLVASRDINGNQTGPSLPYDTILKKWESVHRDKVRLMKELAARGINRNPASRLNSGVSEVLLNRIPRRNLLLMRPLSEEAIQKIAGQKLRQLAAKLSEARGAFGRIDLEWDPAVEVFLQSYQFNAEFGARAIENKVAELVEQTLFKGVFELEPASGSDLTQRFHVSVKENPDRTHSLVMRHAAPNGKVTTTESVIPATTYQKPPARLDPNRILGLTELPSKIKREVFGVAPIADRISANLLVAEERSRNRAGTGIWESAARTVLFLGLSSTGKTELAKVIARSHGDGDTSRMKVIDFSQIRTVQDLKEKILGHTDGYGRKIKSSFMEHYDKYDGRVVFVLDEIANAPLDVLKALYDVLREPVVTTFVDGEPRSMGDVLIIGTGNVGEEWYASIPREIPQDQQRAAMRDVYTRAMQNPGYRRSILEKYFSEALLARIGEQNIYFFPPHSFESVRQLTVLKLSQAIERLRPTDSGWGWDVRFLDESDRTRLIETVETDGFVIREQGASIDRFVKQDFEESLRALLLKNQVAPATEVALSYMGTEKREAEGRNVHHWQVWVEGEKAPLDFNLIGSQDQRQLMQSDVSQILTAYHEAGHEVSRRALFPTAYESTKISIVPGVSLIGGRWVHYLGIAQYEELEMWDPTRDSVVRHLAVLLAGEAAEYLVSGEYAAGKANDIERATALAQRSILKFGLSEVWGNESPPPDVSYADYVATLTAERKAIYESEVAALMNEGRQLAVEVLKANFESHFLPIGVALAEKGTLVGEELNAFYAAKPLRLREYSGLWQSIQKSGSRSLAAFRRWFQRKGTNGARSLKPGIPRPEKIANIAEMIAAQRKQETSQVDIAQNLKTIGEESQFSAVRSEAVGRRETFAAEARSAVKKRTDSCESVF